MFNATVLSDEQYCLHTSTAYITYSCVTVEVYSHLCCRINNLEKTFSFHSVRDFQYLPNKLGMTEDDLPHLELMYREIFKKK